MKALDTDMLMKTAGVLAQDGIVLEISQWPNLKVSVVRQDRTDAQIDQLMREAKVKLTLCFQEACGMTEAFKLKYRIVENPNVAAFNARCFVEAMEILGRMKK